MGDQFPTNLPYKNIILIMREKDGGLPVDYAALSLKNYLSEQFTEVETEIHEIDNPYDFLKFCGAVGAMTYEVFFFFCISHAWPGGLVLNEEVDIDHVDDAVKDKLNTLYGMEIQIGANEVTEFRTSQFRLSNLQRLPSSCQRRMQHIFQRAMGIYILGCNTAAEHSHAKISLTQELANMIRQPVYGAAYSSQTKVWQEIEQAWTEQDVRHSDVHDNRTLTPAEQANLPLILLPSFWSKDGLRMLLNHDLSPIPNSTNLIQVYRRALDRSDPQEDR